MTPDPDKDLVDFVDDLVLPIGLTHAACTFVATLLIAVHEPRPAGVSPGAIVAVAIGAVFFIPLAARLVGLSRSRMFDVLLIGVAIVAANAWAAGPACGAYLAMSYVIIGFAAVVFLSPRLRIAMFALVGVAEALVLWTNDGYRARITMWCLLMGAVIQVSSLAGSIVHRARELARSERAARAEVERSRTELAEVNDRRNAFLARMSHELRTPLNAVLGFAGMLRDEAVGPLTDKQREYADDIVEAGSHLLSLVDDVLDVSRIETGRDDLDLSVVDVERVLSSTIALFRDQAERRGVRIRLVRSRLLEPVVADERKLRQIVLNLLSNAMKFTPPGGDIHVRVTQADGGLAVEVVDNGAGISPADQARIFDEYEQGDAAGHGGTGLGLPVSRRLARVHGGDLTLRSSPGRGSIFRLTVPNAPPVASIDTDVTVSAPHERHALALEPVTLRTEVLGLIAFLLFPIGVVALPPSVRHDIDLRLLGLVVLSSMLVRVVVIVTRHAGRPAVLVDHAADVILIAGAAGIVGVDLAPYITLYFTWAVAAARLALSSRAALLHLFLIGVCVAVLVAVQSGNVDPVARWLLTMGPTVSTSIIVGALTGRVYANAAREAEARVEAERATSALVQAARHKAEFLATMSHELRAPLNVIIGFAEVLQDEAFGPLDDTQREYTDDIAEAGRQLLSLIDDVLDVAKLEAGRMDLFRQATSLADVVDAVVARHRGAAADGGVELAVHRDDSAPVADVDGLKLERALDGLVANALKFTPRNGRVDIDLYVARNASDVPYVAITVADTGPGIAPDQHERVFEPFQQERQDAGGSGLGLSLARGIAELHGGRLTVNSEPGRGSCFTLELPVGTRTATLTS